MMTPQVTANAVTPEKDDPTIWRVDDALWALLVPILKSDMPRKKLGWPRRDDRAIFDGLIWLARTGAQWSQLPREFGLQSTVHERFTEWTTSGALERAWTMLLEAYDGAIGLDWTWRAADGCIVKAPFGKKGAGEAQAKGRNPTDRGKPGTKRHLLTDAKGLSVALVVTGANRSDMTQLAALLDATVAEPIPAAPPHFALDRGYDYAPAARRRPPASTRPTSRPTRARPPPCRRRATPIAIRPAAGSSRSRTVGSIDADGC